MASQLDARQELVQAISVIETAEKAFTARGFPVVRLELA